MVADVAVIGLGKVGGFHLAIAKARHHCDLAVTSSFVSQDRKVLAARDPAMVISCSRGVRAAKATGAGPRTSASPALCELAAVAAASAARGEDRNRSSAGAGEKVYAILPVTQPILVHESRALTHNNAWRAVH